MRHGQQRRRQRIGDLVLDHLRRLAGVFGVDDHLRVREIGQRVERRWPEHRRRRRREQAGDQHQHDVAGGPGDEGRDHLRVSRRGQALQGGLEVAFGVDQEVRGDDDLVAFRRDPPDLDKAIAVAADLHGARLEAAVALVDQHHLARAAVDDGAVGDRQDGRLGSVAISTSAYMSGRNRPSGFCNSIRTRSVRVSVFR